MKVSLSVATVSFILPFLLLGGCIDVEGTPIWFGETEIDGALSTPDDDIEDETEDDMTKCREVIDYDNSADGHVDMRHINTYDEDGNKITFERLNRELSLEQLFNWTYDDGGKVLSKETDNDGDGVIDFTEYYTYNESGNVLTHRMERSPVGPVRWTFIYTYDDEENLISKDYVVGEDGTIESSEFYTYDEDGMLLTIEYYLFGELDARMIYSYDESGNVLSRENDLLADGLIDHRETFTYDEDGNLLREEIDYDADYDDTIEEIITYMYDDSGDVSVNHDTNADGVTDMIETFAHDTNGNILTHRYEDLGNYGEDTDYVTLETYTYDGLGILIVKEYDWAIDGFIDSRITYTRSCPSEEDS